MLVRYQAAPRPEPHGLYVAFRPRSRGSSPERLPNRLQARADVAQRGQRLRVRRRQLELLVALPSLVLEPLLRSLQCQAVLVEQALDAEHHLDIVLPVDTLARVVLARAQQLELRLPVPEHVRRNSGEVGDLADPEEQLVRD